MYSTRRGGTGSVIGGRVIIRDPRACKTGYHFLVFVDRGADVAYNYSPCTGYYMADTICLPFYGVVKGSTCLLMVLSIRFEICLPFYGVGRFACLDTLHTVVTALLEAETLFLQQS